MLATHKTKLVCTIGPASSSPEIILQMLQAGMTIARLNYDRVHEIPLVNLMSHSVQQTVDHLAATAVMVSTASGRTARLISRFKLPVWVMAVSREYRTCQGLQFSYGVHPVHEPEHPRGWNEFALQWVKSAGLIEGQVVLTEGPSPEFPGANHRLKVIDLSQRR